MNWTRTETYKFEAQMRFFLGLHHNGGGGGKRERTEPETRENREAFKGFNG